MLVPRRERSGRFLLQFIGTLKHCVACFRRDVCWVREVAYPSRGTSASTRDCDFALYRHGVFSHRRTTAHHTHRTRYTHIRPLCIRQLLYKPYTPSTFFTPYTIASCTIYTSCINTDTLHTPHTYHPHHPHDHRYSITAANDVGVER